MVEIESPISRLKFQPAASHRSGVFLVSSQGQCLGFKQIWPAEARNSLHRSVKACGGVVIASLHNRDLSKARAQAVMNHVRGRFQDPDLDKEVGMLWLGKEYAQLDTEFCRWERSAGEGGCTSEEINRSAFIAWIDCQL